ncbi:MAG: phosphatase PAP2 family protein [Patescibacteria group bacterium]|nr:phosphatase PAP2 family protein [Patescibacteria group bacterium]MDE2015322.1 phosphatase PAP2 family protein [Patescibacteria group bacterium]MDE2227127.1 phosphatase PAP2 family protein [Patescibacteria group bacterium]
MNQSIFQLIHQLSGTSAILDDLGIFLANYLPYLLVLGFLILVIRQKEWRRSSVIFTDGALAVILSRGIVTEVIRFFYNHPRPFDALGFTALISESGNSFPSGHMTFFFALALIVFYYNKKAGWWYFVLSAIIGLARIYVGVHWPADILGGALIGLVCGLVSHRLVKPYWRKLAPVQEAQSNI